MAGKAHVPSIIREEIDAQLLRAFERKFSDDANEKKATWSLLCGPDKETRSQALNSRKMPRQCHEEWLGRWRAHRACSKTRPVREEVRASLSSRGWNREGTAPQRRRRRLTKRGSAAAGNEHHRAAFLDVRRVAVSLFVFMSLVFFPPPTEEMGSALLHGPAEGAAGVGSRDLRAAPGTGGISTEGPQRSGAIPHRSPKDRQPCAGFLHARAFCSVRASDGRSRPQRWGSC